MSIVLHRHRRDEDTLLAPATHSGPAPELPAEAPFAPGRLGCAPGTSRAVLDDLMAVGRREDRRAAARQIQHGIDMVIAPLRTLLEQPAPVTDWSDALRGVETQTVRAISATVAAATDSIGGHPIDHRLLIALRFDAFEELFDELADEIGQARSVYVEEAGEIELLAIAAGLPINEVAR